MAAIHGYMWICDMAEDCLMDIVKTCKKHGNLGIKDTYEMKTKYGGIIKMCSICKRGYRNDWKKLNPEKLKISEQKKKAKRLQELADGTLKKTCKRHGDLPMERIRIDARGTRVCRLCSNEDKIKSKRKVDPDYSRYKKWLYSDRERVKRYYENDKPKKQKRQMKAYYKIKQTDPERHKKKERQKLDSAIRRRERLTDNYICDLLRTIRHGGRKNRFYHYLQGAEFPAELIALYREHIRLRRELRKRNGKDNKHESIAGKDVAGD